MTCHSRVHYARLVYLRNGERDLRSVCANGMRTIHATIGCGHLTEKPADVTCKVCRRDLPPPVHLHKPAGGTYCGATVTNRATETTAYRSEATCCDCLATLTPVTTVVTVTPQAASMGAVAARIHRAPVRTRITPEQEVAALAILLATEEKR